MWALKYGAASKFEKRSLQCRKKNLIFHSMAVEANSTVGLTIAGQRNSPHLTFWSIAFCLHRKEEVYPAGCKYGIKRPSSNAVAVARSTARPQSIGRHHADGGHHRYLDVPVPIARHC